MSSGKAFYKFLLISVLMEFALFFPLYISRSEEGKFWPVLTSIPGSLVSRANPDVFRWCLELGLFFSLYLFFARRLNSIWPNVAMSFIYFLLMLFQLYYFILWKIYGEIPVFSYDWALFERVLPVFMKTLQIPALLFYSILTLLAVSLIYILFKCFTLIHLFAKQISSVAILAYLSLVFLFPVFLKTVVPHPIESNDTKSAIVWIVENFHKTISRTRVHALPDSIDCTPYQFFAGLPLKSKPNILLIFIEAYGSVLGWVSPYAAGYLGQLNEIENNLALA